jgi:hypothetical protein
VGAALQFGALGLGQMNTVHSAVPPTPSFLPNYSLDLPRDRAPIYIAIRQLTEDRDVATSERELAEELVSDPGTLRSLRSFIEVRHYEDADPLALSATLDFLRTENASVG